MIHEIGKFLFWGLAVVFGAATVVFLVFDGTLFAHPSYQHTHDQWNGVLNVPSQFSIT